MNVSAFFKKIIQAILSPAHCYACKQLLPKYQPLCPECYGALKPIVSTQISINSQYFVQVYAVSAYKNPLKALIRAKNNHDYGAAVFLGALICDFAHNLEQFDYIVPVPLHWTRRIWRGFNQAEIIAHEISQKYKIAVFNGVYRKKRTVFQALLTRTARYKNIENSFYFRDKKLVSSEILRNKKILIIDDLMTSGATVHALSSLLIKAKPEKISAYVAARVIR